MQNDNFPTSLFVRREQDRGDVWWNSFPTAQEAAETEEREIAEYQLVNVRKVRLVAQSRD